nr:hypothetical protein [Deltaproteobacteria bacterium]
MPPDQREDAVHEAVVAVAEECPKWLADDLPLEVVERRLVLRVGGAIHNWQRRQHRQEMGRESLDECADLKGDPGIHPDGALTSWGVEAALDFTRVIFTRLGLRLALGWTYANPSVAPLGSIAVHSIDGAVSPFGWLRASEHSRLGLGPIVRVPGMEVVARTREACGSEVQVAPSGCGEPVDALAVRGPWLRLGLGASWGP